MKKWVMALFIATVMVISPTIGFAEQPQQQEVRESISFADAMKLYLAGDDIKVDKKLLFALLTAHIEKDDAKVHQLSEKVRASLKSNTTNPEKVKILGTIGNVHQEGIIENHIVITGGSSEEPTPKMPGGEEPNGEMPEGETGKSAPTYVELPKKVDYIGGYYEVKKLPQTGIVSVPALYYAATAMIAGGLMIRKK